MTNPMTSSNIRSLASQPQAPSVALISWASGRYQPHCHSFSFASGCICFSAGREVSTVIPRTSEIKINSQSAWWYSCNLSTQEAEAEGFQEIRLGKNKTKQYHKIGKNIINKWLLIVVSVRASCRPQGQTLTVLIMLHSQEPETYLVYSKYLMIMQTDSLKSLWFPQLHPKLLTIHQTDKKRQPLLRACFQETSKAAFSPVKHVQGFLITTYCCLCQLNQIPGSKGYSSQDF